MEFFMDKINVLISNEEIEKRLNELSKQIEDDYEGKEIVFLSVLRGGSFFTINLSLKIKNKMTFEFIEVSSYEGGTESLRKS